jgi:hypothetical protein
VGTDTLYVRSMDASGAATRFWMTVFVPGTFPGEGDLLTPYTLDVFSTKV